MRFHALLPVRDEGDIIAQNLAGLLRWVDAVYVFDTGSLDATWDIVQDFATRDRRVRVLGREPVFFSEMRLRGWMFHQARREMREGDWFLRVDADEFHHVPPPVFVRESLRPHETIAYHQYYDFRLLRSEADAWERGEETLADRARPIEERRRHYTVSVYTEPRLCRYRASMRWPETVSFPFNAGYVARARLPIRHYPHRDPVQLDRRCKLRAAMMTDPTHDGRSFLHWNQHAWEEFVCADGLPGLRRWLPGEELPPVRQTNHLRPPPVRGLQRFVHAFCLPHLDRRRASFDDTARPTPIPPAQVEHLRRELCQP